MSKVKIQANASGTGVFTVTSPATNTDRTITLPDGTGTLLNSDGDGSSLTGVGVDGIVSSADATAITINQSEQVGIGAAPSGDAILDVETAIGGKWACSVKTTHASDGMGLLVDSPNQDNTLPIFLAKSNSIERFKITTDGRVTMPSQPAFNAYGSTSMTNLTGTTTVNFNSEFFDQNSNFNTGTYTFTAPVTGKYQFNATLVLQSLDINHSGYGIVIETSNRNYVNQPIIDPAAFDQGPSEWTLHGSVFVDMDANDTALVKLYCAGGTNVDIYMAGQPRTLFSGFLVC